MVTHPDGASGKYVTIPAVHSIACIPGIVKLHKSVRRGSVGSFQVDLQ